MCHAIHIIWVVPSTQLSQSFLQGITRPLAKETHHLCRILVPTSLGTQEFKVQSNTGHYWSKLILRKDHTFQITAHMSIQWMIGFCIDCQSTEHFLIAINYWLPGKKYFMYWKNLPNPLLYKTKPKGFLSMIWMKHHGTISDKLSQILDRLKMLVSCHLQIAYTS